jgi:cyclopropane fatty-acyl-phospholipid synthase-like methyltransferase
VTDIDWSQGYYETTAADLAPAARELVDAARIRTGEHVVDIGAGTGNVALLAADQVRLPAEYLLATATR